jgi:Fe-S-cluster containining protein
MKDVICPRPCGKCCEIFNINGTKKKLLNHYKKDSDDYAVIKEHFKVVPFEKVRAYFAPKYIAKLKQYTWFTCTALDKDTKLCKVWNRRPELCRGYPLYGNPVVNASTLLHDECYFGNQLMLYK